MVKIKTLLAAGILLLSSNFMFSQNEFTMTEGDTTYTMRKYFLCLLKSGTNRSQSQEEAERIQKAHLEHIGSLSNSGKVCMAGPLDDDGEIRGILVFATETAEEAINLEKEDPAVKAGRLTIEIHPWWAAKGSRLP